MDILLFFLASRGLTIYVFLTSLPFSLCSWEFDSEFVFSYYFVYVIRSLREYESRLVIIREA